ncbi:MAG: hypothetical protein R3F11_03720 [Verrucomicrobiales bacterium]
MPRLTSSLAILAAAGFSSAPAADFSGWEFRQPINAAEPGFNEIDLAPGILDVASADRADLRLADAEGNEVPFLYAVPPPASTFVQDRFKLELLPDQTRITVPIPAGRRADSVALETPSPAFIKPVMIETEQPDGTWRMLVESASIYRENGAEQLNLKFPSAVGAAVRLTIDDRRNEAIPVSGLVLALAAVEPPPPIAFKPEIVGRAELLGRTRIDLDLGAANLDLLSLAPETPEPAFRRSVAIYAETADHSELVEQKIAEGIWARPNSSGEALGFPGGLRVHARRIVLMIENGDSPPLVAESFAASRQPVRIRFRAGAPGDYWLYAGNPLARQPVYDLAALAGELHWEPAAPAQAGDVASNPGFVRAAQAPSIPLIAAAFSEDGWMYRRAVEAQGPGIQSLELPARVLAVTRSDGSEWRVVRGGRQVPFVVERPVAERAVAVAAVEDPDPKRPAVSRWKLPLPEEGLPVSGIACRVSTKPFSRSVALVEVTKDSYGQSRRRVLGSADWSASLDGASAEFFAKAGSRPVGGTLFLEIENGDNAPLQIGGFRIFYPIVRLVFRSDELGGTTLFYGNKMAMAPDYDLGTAMASIRRAPRSEAALGAEVELEAAGRGPSEIGGRPGWLFWIAIAAAVAVLLGVLAKLLPKGGTAT